MLGRTCHAWPRRPVSPGIVLGSGREVESTMSDTAAVNTSETEQSATEVQWRRLRADQLRELARENAIAIVPVGAMEQHGPHLPVEVDSLLAETIALQTARLMAKTAPVVVLPCLWTGI